jgi:hypothetical protein
MQWTFVLLDSVIQRGKWPSNVLVIDNWLTKWIGQFISFTRQELGPSKFVAWQFDTYARK